MRNERIGNGEVIRYRSNVRVIPARQNGELCGHRPARLRCPQRYARDCAIPSPESRLHACDPTAMPSAPVRRVCGVRAAPLRAAARRGARLFPPRSNPPARASASCNGRWDRGPALHAGPSPLFCMRAAQDASRSNRAVRAGSPTAARTRSERTRRDRAARAGRRRRRKRRRQWGDRAGHGQTRPAQGLLIRCVAAHGSDHVGVETGVLQEYRIESQVRCVEAHGGHHVGMKTSMG